MSVKLGQEASQFVEEYLQKGGAESEAHEVLQNLLELSVMMFRKGDIRTINQGEKMELVCQVKKGSRRLKLK